MNMSLTTRWPYLLFAWMSLVSGCASLPDARTDRLDNRQVEYSLITHGSPTVVFESGLGGTMDYWAKVIPPVAKDTTTFAYNRPGYGKSTPASTPRDGEHIVDELRALLDSRKLTPPYVLVGHSLGGLYMQLYARRYPAEVAALILVDSTHPEQLKGAGARENWPLWARAAFGVLTSDTTKAELDGLDATGVDVLTRPPVTGRPVIILSAKRPLEAKSALADDANHKRRDLARLHPGAQVRWVDSGHGIPLDDPQAVIAAIQDVVQQVRAAHQP